MTLWGHGIFGEGLNYLYGRRIEPKLCTSRSGFSTFVLFVTARLLFVEVGNPMSAGCGGLTLGGCDRFCFMGPFIAGPVMERNEWLGVELPGIHGRVGIPGAARRSR